MYIDLHTHERRYSSDSYQSLEDMVETARAKGLDAIAITDHDSMGLRDFALSYSKKVHFPIFVGVEYFSLQGDITAFGIRDFPQTRVSAQEFVDYVRAQGGVSFACHPFRTNNRGLGDGLGDISGLTGVEVLNGSTPAHHNALAAEYCKNLGLLSIGASDAHHLKQLGKYATWIPQEVKTVEELAEVFKEGIGKPAFWTPEGYVCWEGKAEVAVVEEAV